MCRFIALLNTNSEEPEPSRATEEILCYLAFVQAYDVGQAHYTCQATINI